MPLEAGDIQALAAALQGLRPAAPVNATAVKLPQFWQGNPEVWFKQTESVFTTRNPAITTQQTKFDYVIQALDNNTAEKVQSWILNPPAQPYDRLKAALIAAFGKSQVAKDQELLNLNGLGDRKPSELLQHMKNLNVDPNTLFRALFLAQLPPDVRRILATSDKTDIGELAIEADRITEVSRLSNDLQVNAANPVQRNRQQTIPKVGMGSAVPISQTWATTPGLCKYHSRFGELARNCTPPCKFVSSANPGNERAGRR